MVDDEAPIRQLLRRGLESHGYAVLEAADAAAGIAQCAEADPDLVILDLGLPDRDGRELIAEVRLWSRVPILVLSGRCAASEKVAALDLGGSDYVVKPFSMPELLARVRALLRDRPRAREDAPVHRVGAARARRRAPARDARGRAAEALAQGVRAAARARDARGARGDAQAALAARSGGAGTRTTCSICASTSRSCARSSATIRADRASSPTSRASATGSSSRTDGRRRRAARERRYPRAGERFASARCTAAALRRRRGFGFGAPARDDLDLDLASRPARCASACSAPPPRRAAARTRRTRRRGTRCRSGTSS